MELISFIGLMAATGTSLVFIPQAIKTLQTRSTADISLSMYLLALAGFILWLAYGIIIRDLPLMIAESTGLFFSLPILAIKIQNILKGKDAKAL